jgi:hypothetical protein
MGQGASSDRVLSGVFSFRPASTGSARIQPGARETVDPAAELRATSDLLLRDLDALGELEELKRTVPHGDPRLVDIASRIEELARKVLYGSQHQLELTQEINEAADGTTSQIETIDATRSPSAVLADWRDAERRAAEFEPGSASHAEALEDIERARAEYRRSFERARRRADSRS